jgi:hypothetical protein
MWEHLQRTLAADRPAQGNPGRSAEQADPYAGRGKRCFFAGNRQVARCYQLASRRRGHPLHFCNDKLRDGLNLCHQIAANIKRSPILIDVLPHHRTQIMAGTEGLSRSG